MPRALLSVSDKRGITDFARALVDLGWSIVSTGGTAAALRDSGVPVSDVSDVTGHDEIMDGRVKTLHPAVHAGILARREHEDDRAALDRFGYEPFDLVAVNLYPFRETVASGAPLSEVVEQIDIGGPTLIRAAAKNHERVWVVVDPERYPRVAAALREDPGEDAVASLRRELAREAFRHTAGYDAAIGAYLTGDRAGAADEMPAVLELPSVKVRDLRYGENPQQKAAFYAEADRAAGEIPGLRQHHGKDLSFNNLMDLEAGRAAVSRWSDRAACAVIKHDTPCGIAVGDDAAEAVRRAFATDPLSAFGSVVVLNRPVTLEVATLLRPLFIEVIAAPEIEARPLELLSEKKNLRLLSWTGEWSPPRWSVRTVAGGLLAQEAAGGLEDPEWRVVTRREPTPEEADALTFAWKAVACIKSNAILLARGEMAIGIGAGQMSRVDAARIAVMKAREHEHEIAGAVLGSDAFFPFRDGVDSAAEAGVTAIVQPGGSIRDDEVIAAANEHGLAMVFTGRRTFRH